MKILIIEDDAHILSFLKRGLEEEGSIVESASEGEEGEYLALLNPYDVIILDWMLPGKSGLEILQSLREKEIQSPVLMLTARSEISDKVLGLRKGADDYLSKPFSYEELLARIEALYRRTLSQGRNTVTLKEITIDLEHKRVNGGCWYDRPCDVVVFSSLFHFHSL
ncbi:MAG TPA: response regulator transcription factor [Epsilonproteobacteria bacterium]|nr:response regulator transcription factor [Campylobacterota bacterium]